MKNYFSVSTTTLNRLLRILKEENWIYSKENLIVFKPVTYFSYDLLQEVQEQTAIAHFAVKTVFENSIICLAGGSTTVSLLSNIFSFFTSMAFYIIKMLVLLGK